MTVTTTTNTLLSPKLLDHSYTYEQYWDLIRRLIAENKTTGNNHSEDYLQYTKLNIQRMERQDARQELNENILNALSEIKKPMIWLMLTEWWCGDVAQNLPTIAKMAQACPNIDLRLLLRDEHLELMDAYLTNGGRAIPKLIAVDAETWEELGNWGPRPQPAYDIYLDWKNNPNGRTVHDFHQELHKWYMIDKNETLMNEFADLIRAWAKSKK